MDKKTVRNRLILELWIIGMNELICHMLFLKFLEICKEYPFNTDILPNKRVDLTYGDLFMDGSVLINLEDYQIVDINVNLN